MIRLITAAALVTALSLPAMAQTVCGERNKFLNHLSQSYKEAPAALGLVSNGTVLEVLVSKGGTWTIIITKPGGLSCIVAAGEAWEDLPKLALGPAA